MFDMEQLKIDKVKYIILHCTDTRPTLSVDVDTIDVWHRSRGFDCCGYHYVIGVDGKIEIGRDIHCVGAHALGYNNCSIGVAYVGGRDVNGHPADTRTFAQKVAIAWVIRDILQYYPDIRQVIGHNDVSTKVCPCFDAKKEYSNILFNLKNYPHE